MSTEDDKDLGLVQRFQAGDSSAFDELMEKYKKRMFSYVYKSVKNWEDTEDLVQEIFVKVFQALSRWEPKAKFSTWLYTIAHNVCIDFHRANSRKGPSYSIDDEDIIHGMPPVDDVYSDPEKVAIEKEIRDRIQEALEQLSGRQKEVFVLYHYQGLKVREIAEVLGLAEGTVKIHQHRAMEKLRNILEPLISGSQEASTASS